MLHHVFVGMLLLLPVTLAPVPAFAAPVPVGKEEKITELPVPSNSMLVVQVNGVERVRERLTKMVEKADADLAKEASKALDKQLKEIFEDRDLSVLEKEGRLLVSVTDLSKITGDDAPVAVVLPVSDYANFQKKFLTMAERKSFTKGNDGVDSFELEKGGSTAYLVNKGGNVTFTLNKSVAETFAGKFDALQMKQLGGLSEPFLSPDVALFLNVSRVNEEFGGQIAQFRQLFGVIIQQGAMGLEKQQIELVKKLVDGLFQAVEDGKGVVIGVEFRPEGLNLRLEAQFTKDSPSSKAVDSGKPTPLAKLGDLQKGLNSYAASNTGSGIAKLFSMITQEFHAAAGEDKAEAAIKKYAELVAKAESESVTGGGANGTSLNVTSYKNADEVSTALLKVMKNLTGGATISMIHLKGAPTVKEEDQKYGDFKLHLAKLEFDYEASVMQLMDENAKQAAIEAMKKTMPEKMSMWFGTDSKVVVRVMAKDWAEAKKLLDGYTAKDGKASEDAAFLATRKQLPANAQSVNIVDLASTIESLADSMGSLGGAAPGLPVDLPKFQKPKGVAKVYLGYSLTNNPDALRMDLFMPAEGIKVIRASLKDADK